MLAIKYGKAQPTFNNQFIYEYPQKIIDRSS